MPMLPLAEESAFSIAGCQSLLALLGSFKVLRFRLIVDTCRQSIWELLPLDTKVLLWIVLYALTFTLGKYLRLTGLPQEL